MPSDTSPQVHPARVGGDGSVGKNAFWSGLANIGSYAIGFAASVVVARHVTSTDYGIASLAGSIFSFVGAIGTLGFAPAIVSRRLRTRMEVSSAHVVTLGAGCLVAALAVCFLPSAATYFRAPRLVVVGIASAIGLVLQSAQIVPIATMQATDRFRLLTILSLWSQLLGAALSLGLALGGAGVWALVLPNVAASVLKLVLALFFVEETRVFTSNLSSLRPFAAEATRLLLVGLADVLFLTGDNMIVARRFGPDGLGRYSFAYAMMVRPLSFFSWSIAPAMMAAVGGLAGDRSQIDKTCVRISLTVARFSIPSMCGLALVANTFIPVVFGTRWQTSVFLVQIFCCIGGLQAVTALANPTWVALGQSRLALRWALTASLGGLPVFFIGSRFGSPESVAIAFLLYSLILTPVCWHVTRSVCGLRLQGLAFGLLPVLRDTAIMSIAVVLVERALLSAGSPPALILGVAILTGAVTYAISFRTFGLAEMLGLVDTLPFKMRDPVKKAFVLQ